MSVLSGREASAANAKISNEDAAAAGQPVELHATGCASFQADQQIDRALKCHALSVTHSVLTHALPPHIVFLTLKKTRQLNVLMCRSAQT